MNTSASSAASADASVRQVSGLGADGRPLLSVLARRTYRINQKGTLDPLGEPTPLVVDALPDAANADLLAADTDLWPYKPFTDIVVIGHAYGEEPAFRAAISVGERRTSLQIFGERRAGLNATGDIEFTPPTPLKDGKIALSPMFAYGGHDRATETELGNALEHFRGLFPVDPGQVDSWQFLKSTRVTPGVATRVVVEMTAIGGARGEVRDDAGAPVVGARVTATRSGDECAQGRAGRMSVGGHSDR